MSETQEQANSIDIVGLKKDVEFLKEIIRNDRNEIVELRKEISVLRESYGNLVAKGAGVMATIIAMGAAVAWFLNLFKAYKS